MTASFGSATSANFNNATRALLVAQGQAGGFANFLAISTAFQANRTTAGLPTNLFIIYPQAISGASVNTTIAVVNGGSSTYQGLQLEVRRRMSSGLLLQGSYVFAKAMTDDFFALSSQNGADQPRTLRAFAGPGYVAVRHPSRVQVTTSMTALSVPFIVSLTTSGSHDRAHFNRWMATHGFSAGTWQYHPLTTPGHLNLESAWSLSE